MGQRYIRDHWSEEVYALSFSTHLRYDIFWMSVLVNSRLSPTTDRISARRRSKTRGCRTRRKLADLGPLSMANFSFFLTTFVWAQRKESLSREIRQLTRSRTVHKQWYLFQLVRHSRADRERVRDPSTRRTDLGRERSDPNSLPSCFFPAMLAR